METIQSFKDRALAGMAQSYLKDEGIRAVILADDIGGVLGTNANVRLAVDADDVRKAKELLENMFSEKGGDLSPDPELEEFRMKRNRRVLGLLNPEYVVISIVLSLIVLLLNYFGIL